MGNGYVDVKRRGRGREIVIETISDGDSLLFFV
jgi:hypothetical protein